MYMLVGLARNDKVLKFNLRIFGLLLLESVLFLLCALAEVEIDLSPGRWEARELVLLAGL